MLDGDTNVILLHTIPNRWSKQTYLKYFDFENDKFKTAIELSQRIKIYKNYIKEETL